MQADRAAIKTLGEKVAERVSALVFFRPADRVDLYPGWALLVFNPLRRYPLPEVVGSILGELSSGMA
jgi:hypothetical protein